MKNLICLLSCFLSLGTGSLASIDPANPTQVAPIPSDSEVTAAMSDVFFDSRYAALAEKLNAQASLRGESLRLIRLSTTILGEHTFVNFALEAKRSGSADAWHDAGSIVAEVSMDLLGSTLILGLYHSPAGSPPSETSAVSASADVTIPSELTSVLLRKEFTNLLSELSAASQSQGRHLKITAFSAVDFGTQGFGFVRLGTHLAALPFSEAQDAGQIVGSILYSSAGDEGTVDGIYYSPAGSPPAAVGVSNKSSEESR